MNKSIILLILAVATVITIFIFVGENKNIIDNLESKDIILFYSEYCAHCAVVKEYIDNNKIEQKIAFEMVDVDNNSDLMFEKALVCGLNFQYVGVPLLFDGKKCFMGDKDIIDFFNSKI